MKWQIKAAIQVAFGLIPGGERLNHVAQRLNGAHTPQSQYRAFWLQRDKVRLLNRRFPLAGKTIVEIGTGWNGIGILLFAMEGAAEIHTYDHVRHLRLPVVQQLLRVIVRSDPEYAERAGPLLAATTIDELLVAARAHYHAPGDAAATGLPDRSVDLVYSYGVLEHITPKALERITVESARILRGRAFHRIGLHDHFQGFDSTISAANFLQYPDWVWALINNRISYHNRWRTRHYLEMFARHGGRIVHRDDELRQSDIIAVQTLKLAVYKDFTPAELATSQMDLDVVFDG